MIIVCLRSFFIRSIIKMKILEIAEIMRGLAKSVRLWYTVSNIRKGSVFLKKLITAVLAFVLAAFTAALISGCGKSDKSDSSASLAETTAVTSKQSTEDSVPATTSPKVKPTDAKKKQQLSGEVISTALDYCKMSAEYRDCVALYKNAMAHDGSRYHFIIVEKGNTVVPLVISYDAKTVYEPSDFFLKYGAVEDVDPDKKTNKDHESSESSENDDDNYYDEDYDEDYYY